MESWKSKNRSILYAEIEASTDSRLSSYRVVVPSIFLLYHLLSSILRPLPAR